MEAKEKALELIDSFIQASVVEEDKIKWYHSKPYSMAKQCALIAVDELIEYSSQLEPFLGVDWWKEVKSELLKL